jgi:hypothetical protein
MGRQNKHIFNRGGADTVNERDKYDLLLIKVFNMFLWMLTLIVLITSL